MELVFNAMQIVVTIFLLMALGYLLAAKGWFDGGKGQLLSKLVVNVGVPATVFANMLTYYTRESLAASLVGLMVPFLTMGGAYLIAIPLARLIRLPQQKRGVFCVMFSFSNSIFIGLPVATAIFGAQAVPYALLYYVGNTVIFWTIGISGIKRDGGEKASLFSKQTLKNLASPALIAFAACIVMLVFNLKLPPFAADAAKYLGGLVTPCSMLFIGSVLHRIGLKKLYVDRGIALSFAGRFIAAPLLAFAIGAAFSIPPLMGRVFMMQASMPVMSQCSIVAAMYGADESFAAVGTVLTTLFSLVYMPLLMLVMPLLIP